VLSIGREALTLADQKKRDVQLHHMRGSESNPRLVAMLQGAATMPETAVSVEELDAWPMLLTVKNGVVDLATGKLLAPDPELLLTKRTQVPFEPDAKCPRFKKFIREITGGNKKQARYLQRVAGYLLTGDTREQCFFVFHGSGSNGKSTLLRVLAELLGDFATVARMETWTAQLRKAGGPSEDIARLQGARMVSSVESDQGQRLSESLIKELTGQDRVSARNPHERSFEFQPQFKPILVCNHKPVIRGSDDAIWRRVKLVPFEQKFTKTKDKTLFNKLLDELPGILQWAIRGCIKWQKTGLAEPQSVRTATENYKHDSDELGQFIEDRCATGKKLSAPASDLYGAYKSWAIKNGHFVLSNKTFAQRITERGFEKDRKTAGVSYRGLAISKEARK
jgi:putative DNA primase/helicase